MRLERLDQVKRARTHRSFHALGDVTGRDIVTRVMHRSNVEHAGKLADFVVLAEGLHRVDPEKIEEMQIV